ncbi:MAG: hypothetical protein NTZ01_06775 [Verrucomicrobia bacterium]|nr:hypothetical protein [Verrucomicrobiota bacterium]
MKSFDPIVIGAGPGGYPAAIRPAQFGAAAGGGHKTKLIADATLAIRAELTVSELGHTTHSHPTFGEMWAKVPHSLHDDTFHTPLKEKI